MHTSLNIRYQGRHVSARKEILLKIISIKYQYIIKKKKRKKKGRCYCVTRVPLVQWELLTIFDHLSVPPVLSRPHVDQSLVFCEEIWGPQLFLRLISFGHCVACPSVSGYPFDIFKPFLLGDLYFFHTFLCLT